MIGQTIFIPGNVPSSKNSKRWTGKLLINSRTVMDYKKATEWYWYQERTNFLFMCKNKKKPLKIGFKFIRDSRRKFDYVNPLQTIQDLMVKHGWIDDDNMLELLPVFEPYSYDKENPGVRIKIL